MNTEYVIVAEEIDGTINHFTYLHEEFWLKHIDFLEREAKSEYVILKMVQAYKITKYKK